MKMHIQARGFSLTDALREQAERRLRFALGSLAGRIRHVAMWLEDENGPRGGLDKRCRVKLAIEGQAPVVIEHLENDLYAAIDLATSRAGRTLARRLQRSLHLRRLREPLATRLN